jgi:2-C-methyl-D-erythritol 4-phosphate cytidylyltransferase
VELSGIVPLPISVVAASAFAALAGESPLVRTVRVLVGAVADPSHVVVAAAEPLVGDVRKSLASHGFSSVRVATVIDSATRLHCLRTALEHFETQGLSPRYVLVHDITRPLASVELCERVIGGLRDGGTVVVPAVAVTDSIKSVDARGAVTRTIDRSVLQAVQYPRGFATEQLSRLLALHTSAGFDELKVSSHAGVPITLVTGEPEAFRADLPRDAPFVEAIIASRPAPQDS